IAPPGALNDRWSRRLPDPVTAMASGWMRIRQRARQRNVELPLIISDHADWDELTMTIREIAPSEVWITHGREEALKHWCMTHQIKACELNLVGYEDEDDSYRLRGVTHPLVPPPTWTGTRRECAMRWRGRSRTRSRSFTSPRFPAP